MLGLAVRHSRNNADNLVVRDLAIQDGRNPVPRARHAG
jgi:hypothetical protein